MTRVHAVDADDSLIDLFTASFVPEKLSSELIQNCKLSARPKQAGGDEYNQFCRIFPKSKIEKCSCFVNPTTATCHSIRVSLPHNPNLRTVSESPSRSPITAPRLAKPRVFRQAISTFPTHISDLKPSSSRFP